MKIVRAMSLYRKLSAEQQKAIRQRVLFGKHSIRGWLRLLHGLAQFDERRDSAAAWLYTATVVTVMFALASAYIVAAEYLDESRASGTAVVALVVLGILSVGLLRASRILWTGDLPNHLRSVVYPLLRVLAEETSANARVEMTHRLLGRTHKKNLIAGPTKLTKLRPGWRSAKETRYLDDWLLLDAYLADRTRLKLRISDLTTRYDITKRGSSGKIKSKTKYKVRTRVSAHFLAPGSSEWTKRAIALKSKNESEIIPVRAVLHLIADYYAGKFSGRVTT